MEQNQISVCEVSLCLLTAMLTGYPQMQPALSLQDWAVLKGKGRTKTRIVIHVAAGSADLMPTAVALNNALCMVLAP